MSKAIFAKNPADLLFVEDVFSTYLYTGNSSSQTITNNINLSEKGGMVWIKSRSAANENTIFDTERGAMTYLISNRGDMQNLYGGGSQMLTSYTTSGFNLGSDSTVGSVNQNTVTYCSWTFRKAKKFFDVVTYTGTGASTLTLNHSLDSVPGMIIIKKRNAGLNWMTYHRSLASGYYLSLNTTNTPLNDTDQWGTHTSTTFTVKDNFSYLNELGATYVAYLFAHDTSTTGLMQCGSFTTDAGGAADISLGWEPQFILFKNITSASNWNIVDNMRDMSLSDSAKLLPNSTAADVVAGGRVITPNATGFSFLQTGSVTYVYMAIRRGPMKIPSDATTVYTPIVRTGTGANATITTNFPVDTVFSADRPKTTSTNNYIYDRIRGKNKNLIVNGTSAEQTFTNTIIDFANTGIAVGAETNYSINGNGISYATYAFRRAPKFFDTITYTGNGVQGRALSHNLTVKPELIIQKDTGAITDWYVWNSAQGSFFGASWWLNYLVLNGNNTSRAWGNNTGLSAEPTNTSVFIGNNAAINNSGSNYVMHLFASCPGVSKVGTYTGNGTTQDIDCGFTNGARFILIKRLNSGSADWILFDSARGIVAGNDPYIFLSSQAVGEVSNNDSVDPISTGFTVNTLAASGINANNVLYLYLAIA